MEMRRAQRTSDSMVPYVAQDVPVIYGNTPSFLGARPVGDLTALGGFDAIVGGLPWEGTNTWGGYSGCEQTPKACRAASLRYGLGYLPEHDIAVMSSLNVGDIGDLPVYPNDASKTFAGFGEVARTVFAAAVVPVFFGGDHAVTYPIFKELAAQRPRRLGLIQFDAHLDNADEFRGDRLARCCPLRRIAELPELDPTKIVHLGIRGPRNAPGQMRYARERGSLVMTIADVRRQGFQAVVEQAERVASNGTDGYYVTVCSDIVDHAFNPGGALDFGGVSSGEMCEALFSLGQGKMLGLDLVEVYPRSDVGEASVHLMVWLAIYSLAGLAVRKGTPPAA